MDSSWGRLIALAIDEPLDDFDRVAVERAALAVAIDLLGQQHDEQLRARSRGAFLSDLADGRVRGGRRAPACGGARASRASGRGALLPVVGDAGARPATRAAAPRRATAGETDLVDAAVRRAAHRALLDRVRRPARPARRRRADPARARRARATTRRWPSTSPRLFHGALERRGLGARRRGAGDRRRRPRRGRRPARRCGACAARRARRPPCPSRAGTTPAAPASPTCCTTCATRPSSTRSSTSSSGRCSTTGRRARARCWRRSRRTWPRAAARREAARALHLERQSLYLRLHRIEELLGVSLDDEDVVLGLHLAVRALAFSPRAVPGCRRTSTAAVRRRVYQKRSPKDGKRSRAITVARHHFHGVLANARIASTRFIGNS